MRKLKIGDKVQMYFLGAIEEGVVYDKSSDWYKVRLNDGTNLPRSNWKKVISDRDARFWHIVSYVGKGKVSSTAKKSMAGLKEAFDKQKEFIKGKIQK